MKQLALVAFSLMLAGCVTTQKVGDMASNVGDMLGLGGAPSGKVVGPQTLAGAPTEQKAYVSQSRRLDVVVARFDPGLPEDPDDYEKKGIWPELRRAEGRKLALDMKHALQETAAFGDVWVAPDTTPTAEFYVEATILESNGEDLKLRVEVHDSTNRRWMRKTYSHRVKEHWHRDPRNKGKDPFAELFEEAAQDIAKQVAKRDDATLERIRATAELRFAASFSPEAFGGYVERKGNRFHLQGRPAAQDPMLARTNAILVQERLLMDDTQKDYEGFAARMDRSYGLWRQQSLMEAKAAREATMKGVIQGLGAVAIGAITITAVAAGVDSSSFGDSMAAAAGMTAGIMGTAALGSAAHQNLKEAKMHREALNELGESIDLEVGDRNVSFEGKTVKLTGTLHEQYAQWRAFLAKMYAAEATPQTQL